MQHACAQLFPSSTVDRDLVHAAARGAIQDVRRRKWGETSPSAQGRKAREEFYDKSKWERERERVQSRLQIACRSVAPTNLAIPSRQRSPRNKRNAAC